MTSKAEVSNGGAAPLAVTVAKAGELSGFGPTSIWAFLKSGRLEAVRVPGVRRTLVEYGSLARLLAPSSETSQSRRHSPPHKRNVSPDVLRRLDELAGTRSNKVRP
jgi:hypothetical protein